MSKLYLHGGNIRAIAEDYGLSESEITDFSANINPLGMSELVRTAIINNINNIVRYPDIEYKKMHAAFSVRFDLSQDCMLLGNGGAELIYAVLAAIKPKKVLLPVPSFLEYAQAARLNGADITRIFTRENDFLLDSDKVIQMLPGMDMLFICNPNNPTGCLENINKLEKILKEADRQNVICFLDESFIDFTGNEKKYSMIGEVNKYRNLIVLRSMTKFYALPGLRIGFASASPEIASRIRPHLPPWNINTLAECALLAGFADKEYHFHTVEAVTRERNFLAEGLNALGIIKVYPGSANFLFIDVEKSNKDSIWWQERLLREGILVRNCNTFEGIPENYLRVCVRLREENQSLLNAFTGIAQEISS